VEFINHFENVILFLSNSLGELSLATASYYRSCSGFTRYSEGELAMARLQVTYQFHTLGEQKLARARFISLKNPVVASSPRSYPVSRKFIFPCARFHKLWDQMEELLTSNSSIVVYLLETY
jgi:hypothetical protein